MKKALLFSAVAALALVIPCESSAQMFGSKADRNDRRNTDRQNSHYAANQPVPFIDFSNERAKIIETIRIRASDAATYSVWRSEYGLIEGHCPSMGFSIPYGASITSPNKRAGGSADGAVVAQAEPLGFYPPENVKGTWVFCVGDGGLLEPVLIEANVTTYPYAVKVDYDKNRVTKSGKSSISVRVKN